MSFQTLLVHADPGPGSNPRIRLALRVADMFGSAIVGVGAETFDPIFLSGYAVADGSMIETVERSIHTELKSAEQNFRNLTIARHPVSWVAGEMAPDKMIMLHAKSADLIIASRPLRGEAPAFAARPADLIMDAGLPVLLAANGDASFCGDRVVIAWKNSREARRAMADALPFLKRAKAVTIVSVAL